MALKLWQLKHSRNRYQFFITNSWNHSLVLYKSETKLCMNIIINLIYTESSRHISKCKTFSGKRTMFHIPATVLPDTPPHLHPLFFQQNSVVQSVLWYRECPWTPLQLFWKYYIGSLHSPEIWFVFPLQLFYRTLQYHPASDKPLLKMFLDMYT
jgi:hypothetical protein